MYATSYFKESEKPKVPENYDGNAFTEAEPVMGTLTMPKTGFTEAKISPRDEITYGDAEDASAILDEPAEETSGTGILSGLFGGGFKNFMPKSFGGLLKSGSFKIGTEELLLVGIALFLLLSKNGDKECALMLLALLFIS